MTFTVHNLWQLALAAACAAGLAGCAAPPAKPIQKLPPVEAPAHKNSKPLAGFDLQATPRGVLIRTDAAATFESSEAELKPEAQRLLDAVAKALLHDTTAKVLIEGHTDNTGSDRFNEELSQLRAYMVMKALADRGVPVQRMDAQGLGASRPLADNRTPKGRAANRRMEIILLGEKVQNLK